MRYLLALMIVCLIGCELPVEPAPVELAELMVVNGLEIEITDFYMRDVDDWDGSWAPNLINNEPILPGESRVLQVRLSTYDLRAVDINYDVYIIYGIEITLDGYCWVVR